MSRSIGIPARADASRRQLGVRFANDSVLSGGRTGDRRCWRRVDTGIAVASVAVAAGLVGVGWIGSSGSVDLEEQYRWVGLAVGGTAAGFGGGLCLLARMRRAIGERMADIFDRVTLQCSAAQFSGISGGASGSTPQPNGFVELNQPNVTYYHRHDCMLVAGKAHVRSTTPARAQEAGCSPCGICLR